MNIEQLAPSLFVCGQIGEHNLSDLAHQGFTDVVCTRPDAEHPDDAQSSRLGALAKDHGLAFHCHPITSSEPFTAEAQALAHVVARPGAKVLAYCRSGARASNAWTRAQTGQSGDGL